MPIDIVDRARGSLLGLACGDAVGTTLEFSPRGTFEPITDMIGGGPFGLLPGQWTDDTSMALCLAQSLLECGGFDPADQMARYLRWYDEGHLSPTGECFDIGRSVHSALERFRQTGDPLSGSTDPMSAGNGSIMRLAPVVLFFLPDVEAATHYAGESSRTTHGAHEAVACCQILGRILSALVRAESKESVVMDHSVDPVTDGLRTIIDGQYRSKDAGEIRGSGYCVESLEAALWCFWKTDSFEEAVLAAANLGDDADTTAAVTGQIAGAYYGASQIPTKWRDRISMSTMIDDWAGRLMALRPNAA